MTMQHGKREPANPDHQPTATDIGRREAEALQSEHANALYAYCFLFLANAEAARDAAQEVFCRLWTHCDADRLANRAWLYKTARNHCLNTLRQGSRGSRALAAHAQLRAHRRGAPSILAQIVREEIHQRLADLVNELPIELRVPLFLRYFAGLSRSEIVDVLGVSEHVVKARLHSALKCLRRHSSLRMT